jgi:hypothetical protein
MEARDHQIHVDVAETACGDRDVQRRYMDMAVYFGPLAVQASSCQAVVTSVNSPFHTYLEVMKRQVTRKPCEGGRIPASGDPWATAGEHSGDGIAYEVKVANVLYDDLQTWAGAECLYRGFGEGPYP